MSHRITVRRTILVWVFFIICFVMLARITYVADVLRFEAKAMCHPFQVIEASYDSTFRQVFMGGGNITVTCAVPDINKPTCVEWP